MAPNIYMTVGIAGCGKSKFAQWIKNAVNAVEINADNFRAEFGDMSDMSHEEEVWKRVNDETVKQVAGGNNVILSNTNLRYSLIREQTDKFPLNKVVLLIMEDSFNLQLCKDRVAKDLENGIERSKVPPEVSDKQFVRFHRLLWDLAMRHRNDNPKNLKVAMISDTFDLTTIDDLGALEGRIEKDLFFKKKQ